MSVIWRSLAVLVHLHTRETYSSLPVSHTSISLRTFGCSMSFMMTISFSMLNKTFARGKHKKEISSSRSTLHSRLNEFSTHFLRLLLFVTSGVRFRYNLDCSVLSSLFVFDQFNSTCNRRFSARGHQRCTIRLIDARRMEETYRKNLLRQFSQSSKDPPKSLLNHVYGSKISLLLPSLSSAV